MAARLEHGIAVRPARAADRAALVRLGHAPGVARLLAPPSSLRLAWTLFGTRSVSFVAEEDGAVVGSVQFLRSRRSRDTWLFGHWRVAAPRRRQGLGRRLLERGLERLPEAARLYSYVERENEASVTAHERLGFEKGRTLAGRATLASLSTIGAATPSLRLEAARPADWDALFEIHARAMGSLWLRLFPGLGPGNFLGGRLTGLRAGAVAVARGLPGREVLAVRPGPVAVRNTCGYVVWEGAGVTFFADPEACDQALLARVALQVLALGARRDVPIEIRGLPAGLAGRPGPLALRVLMGMPDVRTQWRGGSVSAWRAPRCLPWRPCGRR